MDPLTTVADVAARTGQDIAEGTPEYARTGAAAGYVSVVLRARFPLIPAAPVPGDVRTVATEATVRYLAGDPAAGGFESETIGAYTYRRAAGVGGEVSLTGAELRVLQRWGAPALRALPLSNGAAP